MASTRIETQTIPYQIPQGNGELGAVLTTAEVDKQKLLTTMAFRGGLTLFCLFYWYRQGGLGTIYIFFACLYALFTLSPLRVLGRSLDFCQHGVRYRNKIHLLPANGQSVWTTRRILSVFYTTTDVNFGNATLDITYLKDVKKCFLMAYHADEIIV